MHMRLLAKTELPTHPTLTWPDGRPVQALGLSRRGAPIWPVHGGAPTPEEEAAAQAAAAAAAKAGQVTMTQAELSAMNAREKEQGERAARRKLLEELGLPEDTKPEDVKTKLKEARDAELAALSEVDRAKREAAEAKAEAEREKTASAQAKTELDREKHALKVTSLLDRAGVAQGEEFDKDPEKRDSQLAKAIRYLEADGLEVGADSDKIRAAIEGLKREAPGMFTASAGTSRLPDGSPGSGPSSQRQSGKSGVAAGREEAIRRGWVKEPAKSA